MKQVWRRPAAFRRQCALINLKCSEDGIEETERARAAVSKVLDEYVTARALTQRNGRQ